MSTDRSPKPWNSWQWHDRVFVAAVLLFLAAAFTLAVTVVVAAVAGLKALPFVLALSGLMMLFALIAACMVPFRLALDERHRREVRANARGTRD